MYVCVWNSARYRQKDMNTSKPHLRPSRVGAGHIAAFKLRMAVDLLSSKLGNISDYLPYMLSIPQDGKSTIFCVPSSSVPSIHLGGQRTRRIMWIHFAKALTSPWDAGESAIIMKLPDVSRLPTSDDWYACWKVQQLLRWTTSALREQLEQACC